MKKSTFTIALFLALTCNQLTAQFLDWGYSYKHNSVQNSTGDISSNSNSFLMNGIVYGGINVDIKNGNSAYTLDQFNGSFIAKYNGDASIQWFYDIPSNASLSTHMLDQQGNAYNLGFFWNTVDFEYGSGTSNITPTETSLYVQKLAPNGELIWVAQAPCTENLYRIDQKSNGNIIVAGRAQQSFTTKLSDNSEHTIPQGAFMFEISSTGQVIGVYSIPTPTSYSTILALEIDANDNVIVGFSVDGAVDVDCKAGTINDQSNSAYDALIIKYNANFDYQWHKLFGDVPDGQPGGWDFANKIVAGTNGDLYVCGYYTWTTDFDPDANPGVHLLEASTSSPSPNGYVLKYNIDGDIQWIRSTMKSTLSGPKDVYFEDLAMVDGMLVVSGELNGSADFDDSANEMVISTGDGGLGMCFASYTTDGVFQNAWLVNGAIANEAHTGIEAVNNGFVLFGTFQKQCDIDPSATEVFLSTDETGPFYSADNDLLLAHYYLTEEASIKEVEQPNFSIYPNPSANELTLVLDELYDFVNVKILDIQGRIIEYNQFNNISSTNFNIEFLPNGIYTLLIESNKGFSNKKFIKQ